jgi:hypothetical protein
MAAQVVPRYARVWFCPSRSVPQIRRIRRERWRATHFAMLRVRHSVYRYFQSEDRREKMTGASTESLMLRKIRKLRETDSNVGPAVGIDARIGDREHRSASHKIAQDLFGASAFLVVIFF